MPPAPWLPIQNIDNYLFSLSFNRFERNVLFLPFRELFSVRFGAFVRRDWARRPQTGCPASAVVPVPRRWPEWFEELINSLYSLAAA